MFDELLAANRRYAERFELGGVPGRATAGLAVVTCIDTRIDPLAIFGLHPGEAKIIRNAGSRVTNDVLRSLVLATGLLGVVRVVVMHHTQCALAGSDDDQVRAGMPAEQARAIGDWPLHAMTDPDDALASDVLAIARCAAMPSGLAIVGWRYDVTTGLVAEVVPLVEVEGEDDSHR